MASPRLEFLSLFVPDLEAAKQNYALVFGVEPEEASGCVPADHPYSPRPPVVFDLGGVKLALYQVDGRVTHPGDVGIGVATDEDSAALLERVQDARGQTLLPPVAVGQNKKLTIFVLPDRHFFEAILPEAS